MRGLISLVLVGSLAIALGLSDSPEVKPLDSEPAASLSAVFPSGNVPVNPSQNENFEPQSQPQSQSNPAEVASVSQGSEVKNRVIIQLPITQDQRQDQVFKFQVPLEESVQEERIEGPYGREVEVEQPSADRVNNQYLPLEENEENNGRETSQEDDGVKYKVKPKKIRKAKKASSSDFSSIQDLHNEKYSKTQKSIPQGNGSHVIEQAGTFHNVAHQPHGHYDQGNLGHGGPAVHGYGHEANGHGHAPIVVEDHGPVGHGHNHGHAPIVVEDHGPVGHGHNHGHAPVIENHGPVGHGHAPIVVEDHGPVGHHGHPAPIIVDKAAVGHEVRHDNYVVEPLKSYAKPLKPSTVHRDPHDTFDQYDKIRTQDKDTLHHHNEHKAQEHINYGHGYDHDYAQKGFQPYDYDMNKIPECAFKNKHYYNLTFCLEDHLYPLETILWAIRHAGPYVHDLLSDVTYQSADNLVSGLTRAEEEGYTYQHYFGATHAQHTHLQQYKPPYQGYSYKTDYFKKGGYICPSDIYYGRPRRAMNTYGKWKVIVNVDHFPKPHEKILHKRGILFGHKGHKKPYTQTLRIEQCIYPNAPCSYIDAHYHSSCIQKHNFVRLVAWTIEEGLHVDTFKMPIACSCHIRQPIHFYQERGHHIETHGEVLPHIHGHHGHEGHQFVDGYSHAHNTIVKANKPSKKENTSTPK